MINLLLHYTAFLYLKYFYCRGTNVPALEVFRAGVQGVQKHLFEVQDHHVEERKHVVGLVDVTEDRSGGREHTDCGGEPGGTRLT